MRIYITCIILFVFNISIAQQAGKKFTFKQIGWTIELPNDFHVRDSALNAAKNKKGVKIIEDANNLKGINTSKLITLIGATKDSHNYFNSTITPIPNNSPDVWKNAKRKVDDMVWNTFAKKLPAAQLDSTSSTEVIDGLSFEKFVLTITVQDKGTLNLIELATLYKGYEFGVTYVYTDEDTKNEIESMLMNSHFDK